MWKTQCKYKKSFLYSRGYEIAEEISQKGCGFSILGDFQNLTRQRLEKHP